jgi:hypothetical protein
MLVTVAKWSKVCTVFARSEAEIMGLNPTRYGCLVFVCVCVCVCVCARARFSVFVYKLITRPRSPTECLRSSKPK